MVPMLQCRLPVLSSSSSFSGVRTDGLRGDQCEYDILDKEAAMIEGEAPEREQLDKLARKEVLTCKVGKRVHNQRTFF